MDALAKHPSGSRLGRSLSCLAKKILHKDGFYAIIPLDVSILLSLFGGRRYLRPLDGAHVHRRSRPQSAGAMREHALQPAGSHLELRGKMVVQGAWDHLRGGDGQWYIVYHAYEKGYLNHGRKTLLQKIEWTSDG